MYLPRDQALFLLSACIIHQYPKQSKQQYIQSVTKARLRKNAADTTPVSHDRILLRTWLRESNRPRMITTNNTGTPTETERSIILFTNPLTRDNTINTDDGCTTMFANATPTTLVTKERTTVKDSYRFPQGYSKRRYTETTVNEESLLQATTQPHPSKRQRLIPLSHVLTTKYQYGRVIKKKRKEVIPNNNNLGGRVILADDDLTIGNNTNQKKLVSSSRKR